MTLSPFAATDPRLMPDEPRIASRIGGFKFDNPDHFAADQYDVVFLFGFSDSYGGSRGTGYPADGLSDAELQRLDAFQNGGGGVFATGDHGSLACALCHKIARVRNMRLWQSTNHPAQARPASSSPTSRKASPASLPMTATEPELAGS